MITYATSFPSLVTCEFSPSEWFKQNIETQLPDPCKVERVSMEGSFIHVVIRIENSFYTHNFNDKGVFLGRHKHV